MLRCLAVDTYIEEACTSPGYEEIEAVPECIHNRAFLAKSRRERSIWNGSPFITNHGQIMSRMRNSTFRNKNMVVFYKQVMRARARQRFAGLSLQREERAHYSRSRNRREPDRNSCMNDIQWLRVSRSSSVMSGKATPCRGCADTGRKRSSAAVWRAVQAEQSRSNAGAKQFPQGRRPSGPGVAQWWQ